MLLNYISLTANSALLAICRFVLQFRILSKGFLALFFGFGSLLHFWGIHKVQIFNT